MPDLLVQHPSLPMLTTEKSLCAGLMLHHIWLQLHDGLMQQGRARPLCGWAPALHCQSAAGSSNEKRPRIVPLASRNLWSWHCRDTQLVSCLSLCEHSSPFRLQSCPGQLTLHHAAAADKWQRHRASCEAAEG